LWLSFTCEKELVQLDIKGSGPSLKCFETWNGVAVLHSGEVAAQLSSALLDVALGEAFCHAQFVKPVSDVHTIEIAELKQTFKFKLSTDSLIAIDRRACPTAVGCHSLHGHPFSKKGRSS
jgi:hypothetical protein